MNLPCRLYFNCFKADTRIPFVQGTISTMKKREGGAAVQSLPLDALVLKPTGFCRKGVQKNEKRRKMTPAVRILRKAKIDFAIHEYLHDPKSRSYGEEASEKLGVGKDRVFKTLMVSDDNGKLCVGIIPVSSQLNLKLFARAIGAKKAAMADRQIVEKTTGYVLGGISPIGQKKKLLTIIHETAKEFPTIFVSAGKRGLEIELAPDDLIRLTEGVYGCIC